MSTPAVVAVDPLAWWALDADGRLALHWLVTASDRLGAEPYPTDLIQLQVFERGGIAIQNAEGQWVPTEKGRAVYATRLAGGDL